MCLSCVEQGWNYFGRWFWGAHRRLVCVQEEGSVELAEGESGRRGSRLSQICEPYKTTSSFRTDCVILGYVVDGDDHNDPRYVFLFAVREFQRTHIRPGEICNFAAYAFVEAIVVVRWLLVFQSDKTKTSPLNLTSLYRPLWAHYPS